MTTNFAATAIGNGKEVPPSILVHGEVMVYSAQAVISLEPAEPQGSNHTILLVDLIIKEDGPMKGTMKPFMATWRGPEMMQYRQVQIRTQHQGTLTVDVLWFG